MLVNQYVNFKQNNINMYMISLPVKDIVQNYEVDIYDSEENTPGYQRPPIPTHIRDIGKYLLNNDEPTFLPSAVIGAINEDQIKILNQNTLEILGRIRIVDGQHRIKGFEYAINQKNTHGFPEEETDIEELKEFQLPLILMAIDKTDPKERLNEIIAFIDINSKGKKVSTDLAINLRNEMYITKEDYLFDNTKLQERVATETSKYLTNNPDSNWFKAIKLTPRDKGKIISLNLFNKSLFPIIRHLIKLNPPLDANEVYFITEHLQTFIDASWKVIYRKWNGCFTDDKQFKKEYNIQKGIGVHAFHLILEECISLAIEESDKHTTSIPDILQKALNDFEQKISDSPVTLDDWDLGGKFSGYNSASGFKRVKFYIINGTFPK